MFLRNLLLAGILATTFSSSTLETQKVEIEPRAPICYRDQTMMVYHEQAIGSRYSRSEGCTHYTFGTDRVWYQDYISYYECPSCGNRTGNTNYTVEVGRDCFGYN